jgi:hypothetical protein
MQSAVLGALTTGQDPAKLQGFAQELRALYPIAAGLLMAKANALRVATAQPAPAQPAQAPPQQAPQPTPVVSTPQPSSASSLPVGDASTRAGRNAGRPSGYPFIHLRGESTYPAKIAQQATGVAGNYTQMSRINPQFARDGVHWMNIQTGDALNIPWEWVPKLASLYHIEVDPGVQGPAAQPTSAPARRPQATYTAGEPASAVLPPLPIPVPLPQPHAAAPSADPLTLDPGMPPEVESAVLGALMSEQDPAKLQAFAIELQLFYPLAAGLLAGKANALRALPAVLPEAQQIFQAAAAAVPAAALPAATSTALTLNGGSHAVAAHP